MPSAAEKPNTQSVKAWDAFVEKLVGVRRNSKERTEKKRPATYEREKDDAIAELDNVIDRELEPYRTKNVVKSFIPNIMNDIIPVSIL